MINFGFKSGKNMPNVYLELTPLDRILEGLIVLFAVAAWVLTLVLYYNSSLPTKHLFIVSSVITMFTLLFLWSSRAPIRFYNFPVILNERNYVMQYFIASRFTRIIGLLLNPLLFFQAMITIEPGLNIPPGFFLIIVCAFTVLLLASFIGYYIVAFRHR